MNNFVNAGKKKKKFNFAQKKENLFCSLSEVECFLNSVFKASKGIKFYKFLSK